MPHKNLFPNLLKVLKKVHLKKHYDHTQYLFYNILCLMHFIFSPPYVPLGHSNKICLLNHIVNVKFKESFL